MTFAEFTSKSSEPDAFVPDPAMVVRSVDDGCVVDEWFPLALAEVSSGQLRHAIHPVVDLSGAALGELMTCKGEEYRPTEFSAQYLAAYLADASADDYGQPGVFRSDYLLCPTSRLEEYKRLYLASSAVWGGFLHSVPSGPAAPVATRLISTITAVGGLILPTDLHEEAMTRSVVQPHAFERFLKLYHLLELSFDYLLVEEIRQLGTDLRGVGQLLANYKRGELERLEDVIARCVDPLRIAECLRVLCRDPQWHPQISTIFFDYGKTSNPLAANRSTFEDLLRFSEFTESNAIAHSLCKGSQDPAVRTANFAKLTLSVAGYWIYRIRCCVAHNKIGEYVMRLSDEPFVEHFAEPLLRSVLTTVLV